MTYEIAVGNQKFSVDVLDVAGGTARVTVNGAPYEVVIENYAEVTGSASRPSQPPVVPPSATTASAEQAPVAPPLTVIAAAKGTPVVAPMPGVILSVKVQVGEQVAVDQTVVTMEAMKMENNIAAPSGGTVSRILVSPGMHLSTGDVILFIG